MKNKKLILALIALIAAAAVMVGIFLLSRPETQEGSKEITITVIHKDGTANEFTYSTDEEYLGAVLLAEGLIAGDDGAYGLFVTTVDGEVADWNVDQSYWCAYIGEEMASTGVDGIVVTDGGSYKLVYTIG